MGAFRAGKSSQTVVGGDSRGFGRFEGVRFSDAQFDLAVHGLHDPTSELPLGGTPVQNQVLVGPDASGHLADPLQSASQGPLRPAVETEDDEGGSSTAASERTCTLRRAETSL